MPELPNPAHIAPLGLGFAVVAFIITLAQRLGEWRSKTVANILGAVAALMALCWIYLALLWVFRIDLRLLFRQRAVAFWIVIAAVSLASVAMLLANKVWPTSQLTLLSVMVTGPAVWSPQREDLRGRYVLRLVFRSDYDKPVSVRAIHWAPCDPASALNTKAVTHGLQTQKLPSERGPGQGEWVREGGFEALTVNHHQIFCATVEAVGPIERRDLERLRDAKRLGTLTLLVEGVKVSVML